MARGKHLFIVTVGTLALVAGALYPFFAYTIERIHAKVSVTHVTTVGRLLVSEHPRDYAALLHLIQKYRFDEQVLSDGWGNPLVIDFPDEASSSYVVRCLGRDGVRGSCCDKFVGSFDDDAVWADGKWLQVYSIPSRSPLELWKMRFRRPPT